MRTRQREVVDEYVKRAERADNTFFRNDPSTPFMHMLNGLPRVKGLVFGMFGEWSQDVAQLLKLAAGNLAARWAALNGLSAEDALQACTWDLKRRWSLTALRANARVRIEVSVYGGRALQVAAPVRIQCCRACSLPLAVSRLQRAACSEQLRRLC